MTVAAEPTRSAAGSELLRRCSELAVPLVEVDAAGKLSHCHVPEGATLAELVARSGLFRRALGEVARHWNEQASPAVTELWPGCMVAPLPRRQRRRAIGYFAAILLTDQLLESEQLDRIIDGAQLDVEAFRQSINPDEVTSRDQALRLGLMLQHMGEDLHRQHAHDTEIATLSQHLAETYEELSLVYRLSARMTVTEAPETFLDEALAEVQQVIGLRWVVMQLDPEDERLHGMQGKLIAAGVLPLAQTPMVTVARRVLADPAMCEQAGIVRTEQAGQKIENLVALSDRLLIVPLQGEHRPMGVIIGADKVDDTELSSIDTKLVNSLAQNITIFLENAMLYDDLQDMFMGMLRSLVNAIDAKDTYTCGHSERVAMLGRQLGQAAGLDPKAVERLYLSGLLHDVGKIGVPESVLTKPGRLTDEESDIIKTHPRIGGRILEGVRQMTDLIPGVLYHHERYDGLGYPDGLAGEDIPLFGRLLCLADSFDAMSSTRTYRKALPLAEVLDEVRRCAGAQFDPDLAEVFVTLDFAPYHRLVVAHQQREGVLRQELQA